MHSLPPSCSDRPALAPCTVPLWGLSASPTAEGTETILSLCRLGSLGPSSPVGTPWKSRSQQLGRVQEAQGPGPSPASGAEEMGLEGTGVGWQPGEGPYGTGPLSQQPS